jgi:F-type H+-transporting ATPase subunit delta
MPQAVASRYAKALADAVLDPKNNADAGKAAVELTAFERMLAESLELRNVLHTPAVSASRKRAVISRFAEGLGLSRLVRNFLYILIDHGRIGIVGDIRQAFETELDARTGVIRADIRSAASLSESQQTSVQAELSRLTGKQVRGRFSVDPSLLGGMVARIGSTVYDGSVRTQLELMRDRLTGR